MATIYATVADIERELKALLPDGFPVTPGDGDSTPSAEDVAIEITRVTTGLRVRVVRALGAEPDATSDAAQLVQRGVVAQVTAWVLRRVSTGMAAVDVEKLMAPHVQIYRDVLKELEMLPDLYRQQTQEQRRVGRPATSRDPVLGDDALSRTDLF